MYNKFHSSHFLMVTVLILVGHKNNFDYEGDKIPQAWAKGKESSEGDHDYLFWAVSGEESWI